MKTKVFTLIFVLALGIFVFGLGSAEAANCGFHRDLGVGARGSDVSCLQQYLNSTGVYGYLNPDGVYGNMTSQAVWNWQAQNGIAPSGYFGASSRTKYFEMNSSSSSTFTSSTFYTTGQVLGASTELSFPTREAEVRQKIADALDMIEEAEEEIEDSNQNTSSARSLLEDAKEDIIDAVTEFFVDRDYNEAEDLAEDALENAEDAIDEAEGDGDFNSAEDAIEDAEEAIEDAEDEIDDARDNGQFVGHAEDLLEDAEDLLDEAEEEFDDGDYDEAQDLAEEAEDLANEAIDEIN